MDERLPVARGMPRERVRESARPQPGHVSLAPNMSRWDSLCFENLFVRKDASDLISELFAGEHTNVMTWPEAAGPLATAPAHYARAFMFLVLLRVPSALA
jgi:hypothetical protein